MGNLFKLSVLVVFVSSVFMSCSKDDYKPEATENKDAIVGESIKSVLDPETGNYVAPNFNIEDYIVVDELPVPSDKKLAMPGGMIQSTQEVFAGPRHSGEQYCEAYAGYVITGVGATIASSSKNYTSLAITYRYINADGTFGPRYLKVSGNQLTTHQLEAWAEVPNGAVVYSIGVRGKYDVNNLTLGYRYLNSSTKRLTGSVYYMHSGTEANGSNLVTYYPNQDADVKDRMVIQGVGLTSYSDKGTRTIRISAGILK